MACARGKAGKPFDAILLRTLREYRALLASGAGRDADDFATMLRHAVNGYGVPVRAVVEGAGVTKGTVSKWQRGLQLPDRTVRGAVAAVVLREVESRLKAGDLQDATRPPPARPAPP